MNKINLALILLTAFLLSCQTQPTEKEATATTVATKTQTVEVIKPSIQSFKARVLVTGTAMPNQKVMVYAMESGYVQNIQTDIGSTVNKGSVIATMQNPMIDELLAAANAALKIGKAELTTKNAELEAAEATAKAKKSLSDRLNTIAEKTPQLTPLVEVENAQGAAAEAAAMVKNKEAAILAQKSKIEALKQKLTLAEKRKGMLTVRAPFSGVVSQRMVDNGALLQSGLTESNPQAIVEVQQTNPIRLSLPLPEADATAIREGMDVSVTFPELPGESFAAKISRMAKVLDPNSKTMKVEIDLPNADSKILAGMYAKVQMQLSSRESVLSLPIIAKTMFQDEPHVLVVKNGVVERIALRIGLSGKDYFEVLNPEITAESLVIVKGKSLVKAGQKVEAVLK